MMADSRFAPPARDEGRLLGMLQAASAGTNSEMRQLFESTRRYLLLVANRSLDSRLQPKIAPSDLVQQTFVDALRDFEQFIGTSDRELLAWLRQILLHKAGGVRQSFETAKRSLAKEQPLLGTQELAGQEPTPSHVVMRCENNRQLVAALEQLPTDYRRVIEIRSYERLSFAEVGQRMGRSEDAAGKLWCRAIEKLRELIVASDASACLFPL